MQIVLDNILSKNDIIAVALSGGCDSMCLLHFLRANADKFGVSIIAVNVEHGIRGENSISDTNFVKDYCQKNDVKLLTYSVNSLEYASKNKLSVEQAARILRYQCFKDAIDKGECTKIATAHHRDDNVETVLFNLFRGTGLKGLSGITKQRQDNIIRPFLSIDRVKIENYAKTNNIPFVIDETNLEDNYTRNFIRHNVIPKIKEIFPELNQSIERLSEIAFLDDEYINTVAQDQVKLDSEQVYISIPCHKSVLSRAIIIAFKSIGIKKDWEKTHIDSVIDLASQRNGSKTSLLCGVTAIKEYDKIVFYKECEKPYEEIPFALGQHKFLTNVISIKEEIAIDLKSGLYADLDKIPPSAVIRTRKDGDVFTKFGGGTKLLNDYFTDKKIPLRERDDKILVADGKVVFAIFGLAISNSIKVDANTKTIISFNILN